MRYILALYLDIVGLACIYGCQYLAPDMKFPHTTTEWIATSWLVTGLVFICIAAWLLIPVRRRA